MGRQVSGQIRAALGRNQQPKGDVWETATTEPPDEAPECAWCPLCRAARLLRETKPGRDTRVTAVSDALGTVVQDAFNVLDAALATTGRAASGDGRRGSPADTARSGPAKTDAARPGGTKAGPARPGGATTGPATPGGATTGPATPGGATTDSAKPGGTTTGPAKTGPGKSGPVGKPGTTAHGTGPAQPVPNNGQGTAKRGPGDESGAAGQGPGSEPAPDSPEGSLHEPDDRD
jgi:hypothetical protein